jgi:ribosomal protein S18 acetylase RimI-like enzyme
MKRDFQTGGLAPFSSIKRNLDKNIYDGFYLTDGGADVGYALITAPDSLKYALINYFAVLPEYRSKGCGSEFLRIIVSRYSGRVLVLEAEDPSAAESAELRSEAERRIKFYERAGFRVIPTKRAKIFGVDMLIMANSREENLDAREIMHALYLPAFESELWLKHIDVI